MDVYVMDNGEETEPQKNIYSIFKCVYEHYFMPGKSRSLNCGTIAGVAGVVFEQKNREMKILTLKSLQYVFEISNNT